MADATEPHDSVTLRIDGHIVTVPAGTTIWEAARQAGIDIPALCHDPGLEPVGVCRMCVVDLGERTLAASCVRKCHDGMQVETSSEKIQRQRRMLTRLLMREYPTADQRQASASACELESLARRYDLVDEEGRHTDAALPACAASPAGNGASHPPAESRLDLSSPVIAVDHAACILCDRCIRACDDVQNNHVIGRTGKGHDARIAFDLDQPMGKSTCVSCGECAAACPTDALTHRQITLPVLPQPEDRQVESVCPYCGVGCATEYTVRDNSIVQCDGRESPVNHERLCVKGRYGWDYTMHPQRLTTPLIRREEAYPKGALSGDVIGTSSRRRRKPGGIVDYGEVLPAFREATWDEALNLVARRLTEIRTEHGSRALAGFGSAKCSNEEAYLFQKLIRAGLGTNNVDHCTRLCHASSVAALMETIGSGAVTNVFADVANADVCLVTGSNSTANHPVAATFIKQAVRNGTKLICVDPRRHSLTNFATHFAQIRSGSDVAFYNAVMHVLIAEDLIDEVFVAQRTEGFEELKELLLRDYSPEQAAPICGIEPDRLRAIARTIGTPIGSERRRPRMLVFWGMGISQHTHGTDNARCLISLCLLTGNVGKPGTGLHPLRGQNNVQGASDAGLIPIVYPDYQPVGDPDIRAKFEQAWGVPLDPDPGLTVVEIVKGALEKSIRGMYILGENPFLSDPNINKVRAALSSLDFLAVQDIFLTETAEFADVILPASSYFEKDGTFTNTDRRVQVGRKVLDSPGEARQDWQVICEIARRVGLPMEYASASDVFDEFASLTKNYQGLSHASLGATGKLWPCPDPENGDGVQILFGDRFPTANGRGRLVPCPYLPADELPDDEYPLILNTGRVLEHWHTGSMTRRSRALDAIQPDAFVAIHPDDLQRLRLTDGERVRVASRRGAIELQTRADRTVEAGTVFIPFHFREAAANMLTTDALDPFGKIPEFKFCAVRIEPIAESNAVST
ncbi:formate dehydrogenase subunit alpha [Maioricimonas sp. JC845]|uniref:formate dehydrogenase subunit alpha n=1 Tax=Maioricimonas sp. JC845 TaxID=3232138 RepID=UPI003457788B